MSMSYARKKLLLFLPIFCLGHVFNILLGKDLNIDRWHLGKVHDMILFFTFYLELNVSSQGKDFFKKAQIINWKAFNIIKIWTCRIQI